MALYWLDVVRFADTAGYHSDNHRDVCARIATTSSTPSTRTSRSTSSRSSSSPATCCPTPRASSGSPRATTACCRRPKKAALSPRNTRPSTPPTACATRRRSGWPARWAAANATTTSSIRSRTRTSISFAAFFADVSEKAVGRQDQTKIPTPEQEAAARRNSMRSWPRCDEQVRMPRRRNSTAAQAKWEAAAKADLRARQGRVDRGQAGEGRIARAARSSTVQTTDLSLATGPNPAEGDLHAHAPQRSVPAFAACGWKRLTDASFPNKGLSRSNGNFVLTEVEVEAVAADEKVDAGQARRGRSRFLARRPTRSPSDRRQGRHRLGRRWPREAGRSRRRLHVRRAGRRAGTKLRRQAASTTRSSPGTTSAGSACR